MVEIQPRQRVLFFDWRDIRCGALAWATPQGEVYGVGNPPGAQVDMHAGTVAVPHGIRLEAQQPVRQGPVAEWAGWGRIIREDGMYRSWYMMVNGHSKLGTGSAAYQGAPELVEVCRVESRDGFAWGAPHRCRIDVRTHSAFDGVTFFVDPVAPPAERYKLVYDARVADGAFEAEWQAYWRRHPRHQDARLRRHRYALFAAVSPDGFSWTPVPQPLMFHPSDTDTTVYYDGWLGKYVLYTRLYREDRRWVGRAESEDFRHWGPIEPVIWPRLDGPPDHDIYLNGFTLYPGQPDCRLMFPMVWHRFTERSDIRLYASADGIAWNEVPGGPVISPGPVGAWDSEFLGSGKDLLPFEGGRVGAPYSATEYPHKYPRWPGVWDAWKMGWAFWPEDRLCALAADREGGFATTWIVPAGRTLKLNFVTPRAGEIRVGVEGVAGRSVDDCDPLHGDHAGQVVTWRGQSDLGAPAGEPVSLVFRMRCAKLFALRFG